MHDSGSFTLPVSSYNTLVFSARTFTLNRFVRADFFAQVNVKSLTVCRADELHSPPRVDSSSFKSIVRQSSDESDNSNSSDGRMCNFSWPEKQENIKCNAPSLFASLTVNQVEWQKERRQCGNLANKLRSFPIERVDSEITIKLINNLSVGSKINFLRGNVIAHMNNQLPVFIQWVCLD